MTNTSDDASDHISLSWVRHQSIISLSFFIFQIFVDSFYMNSRFFVILFALAALSTAEGILSFVEWLSSLWKIFW